MENTNELHTAGLLSFDPIVLVLDVAKRWLVILLAAAIFTGDSLRAEDVLLCFINGVIVAMAAVGSFHAVQEQMK